MQTVKGDRNIPIPETHTAHRENQLCSENGFPLRAYYGIDLSRGGAGSRIIVPSTGASRYYNTQEVTNYTPYKTKEFYSKYLRKMKKLVFLSLGLLLCCGLYAQEKVDDFFSLMTSAPVEKKTLVMDVIYVDGKFSAVEKRMIESKKPSKSVLDDYTLKGKLIDSLGLIDYKSDTLYIISTCFIPGGVTSEIFKIRKDPFYLIKDSVGEYYIKYFEDQSDSSSSDPTIKASDSLFLSTIYSWNIELLIQIIKSSGGYTGDEYFISATRIIIRGNKVINKEIINFKPAMRWHL